MGTPGLQALLELGRMRAADPAAAEVPVVA
jgi:hypothetical protein